MILIGYAILVTITLVFIFRHKNKFTLNEKSLHKQWLFWLAIIAPLVSGIYFGSGIWSEFYLRLDFKGFSNFFEISKFPFGILALSPILGAFVVSAHRSIQTAKQIEVTEKKNIIDIYYARKKSIVDDLNAFNDNELFEKYNSNLIYRKMNSGEKFYKFEINKKTISRINREIWNTITHYKLAQDVFHKIADKHSKNISEMPFLNIDHSTHLREYIESFEKIMKILSIEIKSQYLLKEDIIDFQKILINMPYDSYTADEINEYYDLVSQLIPNTSKIFSILENIFLVIFPDEKITKLIPNFYLLNDPYIGDKVAAENQNNHE
ncbi:hypothetical protein GWI68_13210 [Proteus sp. G2669]|uniref:hypothetical protein n=1 Tax=Proteus sp. G2669 TaxID=2698881 RepID=UPI00141271E8|nr:hypothetical protein [Proteus sp. G2669]NBM55705.1 hypothetical protein [Proteus sp. G2669]